MPSLLAQSLHTIIPLLAGLGTIIQLVVLAALLLASIISWSVVVRKWLLLRRVQVQSATFRDTLRSGNDLDFMAAAARRLPYAPSARVFHTVYLQFGGLVQRYRMMWDHVGSDALALTHDQLRQLAQEGQGEEIHRLERGLSFLATTAGVAPFLGLLGTVWGIMQSFHAIGKRGGATLAVVGPGISEALVATAAGLAVAIPAVIAYNYYLNRLRRVESELNNVAEEITLLLESSLIQEVQRQDRRSMVPRSPASP